MLRSVFRRLRSHSESADDYAGVLIPLDEAHLHSHSARTGRTEYEELPSDEAHDDGDDSKDSEHESTGMLEMNAAEYSIDGLRKEVRRGEKVQWSDYECELYRYMIPLRVGTTNDCTLLLTLIGSEIKGHK
jgi:hypothetical protein